MEYKLPDLKDEAAYIKSLHPDAIAEAREKLQEHINSVVRVMDDVLEHQHESTCHICGELGYGYKDIPEDWAYIADEGNTLLCNTCIGRWHERFELPELTRELSI